MNDFDTEKIREDFPILKKKINGKQLIYFDNAATTQKPTEVIDGIKYFYENLNANPLRSIHTLAEESTKAYTEAKEKIARFINADSPDEIIFTKNTTESINLVSFSLPFRPGDRVATTMMEHHSNILPWLRLKPHGVNVDIVDTDENLELDYSYYEKLPNDIKLVTVTHESNVSGTINDVERISKLAHEKGALVLVDGAQSVPHMKVDVKRMDCDFLAFSGHKMLGPTGIGVLYIRGGIARGMNPFLTGGEMIKSVRLNNVIYADPPALFEAGTQNVEGAYGLGLAIDYLNKAGMDNIERHEKELTEYALKKLSQLNNIEIYSGKSRKFGAIISFSVKGLHPHDVAYLLDREGIAVRSGFHCAQPFIEQKLKQHGIARASFYLYNTREEIDRFADALKSINKREKL
ncbi:cysteine desulfurase [Candidatus Parvarchaeota archaeon]|uniref:Cysteine desulfurase n=2 Tax=Candidatus Acidifodinimicrobium mancum TaxID=2898728 RepID=A0A8T3UQV0_9ARCH|nr:cysteine desulfurase [Candidatus Acidifodinimicrobium mancum]MBE5729157.1 cysteine desulfurase [Candidatus Acidifodinimicrobium mancum]MBE5729874.1 cysteine desulfurase [Candidatus Acidifodinimicrobium mancum]